MDPPIRKGIRNRHSLTAMTLCHDAVGCDAQVISIISVTIAGVTFQLVAMRDAAGLSPVAAELA